MSGQPQRAVLYARVSAVMGREGEAFRSPDLQVSAMRRHAAPLGLREVGVVQDIDVTGRTFSRDGLDRIRAMVTGGLVDVVAVYDLSRLGRNALEALQFIRWLDDHHVTLVSTVEKIDDTPEGRLMLTQWLAFAEFFSNQIGRRWSETIAARTRAGHGHGPQPPYGYTRVPAVDGGPATVEPDLVAAPIVAAAFGMYADGTPVGDIIRYVSAARGWPIGRSAVKRIFHNPFYFGQVRVSGEVFAGRHPALVDAEVWTRVQARLRRDATTPARRLAPVHALTGLCLCEECSRPMVCRMDRGDRRLECQAQAQTYSCEGAGSPLVVLVEQAVLEQVTLYIDKLTADPQAVAARRARQVRARADVKAVEGRLAKTRGDMVKLTGAWRDSTVPDWLFEQQMAALRASEDALAGQLDELAAPPASTPVKVQVSLARRLLELWPDALPGERRRLIGLVVRRVWVRRAGVWREPVAARVRVEPW